MNAADNRSYLAGRVLGGKTTGSSENPARRIGWRVLAGGEHHAIPERIPA